MPLGAGRSSNFFFSIAELSLPSRTIIVIHIYVVPEWVVRAYISGIVDVKFQLAIL
jgi:hypothetical protein